MTWLQLEVSLRSQSAEPVEAALLAAGAVSITFTDAADEPLYEPDPEHPHLWTETRVMSLFPPTTNPDVVRTLLIAAFSKLPPHRFTSVAERDWAREWLTEFKPMRFGKRLWICPTPYAPPDPAGTHVMLDPGLAFGTGTHATTGLCLDWLDGAQLIGQAVIDYGCGSGILAIAAARLGARQVFAVDNDPQARIATRQNRDRNDVAEIITVCPPDRLPAIEVDILLANILARPLQTLASNFAARLKPGGTLVLSGILASEHHEIHAAYAPWFRFRCTARREDWLRMEYLRQPGSP